MSAGGRILPISREETSAMQIARIARILPAAALALAAGPAAAAGFQLLEQNASGIANAYAGSAAVADNASTIYFNPAGMTRLAPREFSVGVAGVRPSFEFSDRGSQSGVLRGDTSDAGSWSAVPNAYLSWRVDDDVYLGFGLGAPFGLDTEYDDDWVGAAQSIHFDVRTYNLNPSIAWRVNERVSLGFGFNWQRIEAEYLRTVGVANLPAGFGGVPFGRPLAQSRAKLEVDDDSWGWNAGALFALSAATTVGVSYRSAIEHELEGDLKVSGPSAALNRAGSSDAEVEVELPETFIFSVVHAFGPRWELLGDLSWTGWSSVGDVNIDRSSGPQRGTTAQVLEAEFKDTWRVAVGANYRLDEAWKLKFGLAFDESPVKSAEQRLAALPDYDRIWFAFGGQWRASEAARLDLGAAWLYVKDTEIDNDQREEGRGRVTGDYDSGVWVLGAQYSMSF
jgi:long-chain fatty acid transport protein